MKGLPGRMALAAIAALAFGGCALRASPADKLVFKAPADWTASPGILGVMQFWHPPSNDGELLMLVKSPENLKPTDVFSDQRFHDTLSGATMIRRSAITICGGQPATYVEAHRSSQRWGPVVVAVVMTDIGGTTYFATYDHPVGTPPNAAALAALRELCSKP